MDKIVYRNIELLCKEKGITDDELANGAGIDVWAIRYERLKKKQVALIADYLGKDEEFLYKNRYKGEPIYYYSMDKNTGAIKRTIIDDYYKDYGTYSCYKSEGRNVNGLPCLYEEELDIYKNGRLFTHKSDPDFAISIFREALKTRISRAEEVISKNKSMLSGLKIAE